MKEEGSSVQSKYTPEFKDLRDSFLSGKGPRDLVDKTEKQPKRKKMNIRTSPVTPGTKREKVINLMRKFGRPMTQTEMRGELGFGRGSCAGLFTGMFSDGLLQRERKDNGPWMYWPKDLTSSQETKEDLGLQKDKPTENNNNKLTEKEKVVAFLRKEGRPMTATQIGVTLGLAANRRVDLITAMHNEGVLDRKPSKWGHFLYMLHGAVWPENDSRILQKEHGPSRQERQSNAVDLVAEHVHIQPNEYFDGLRIDQPAPEITDFKNQVKQLRAVAKWALDLAESLELHGTK